MRRYSSRGVEHLFKPEFFVDDAVTMLRCFIGTMTLRPCRCPRAVAVEGLLHREAGAEQADRGVAGLDSGRRLGRRCALGDADGALNGVGDLVHGVVQSTMKSAPAACNRRAASDHRVAG